MSTPATKPLHVLIQINFLPDCNLARWCEVFTDLFNCCTGHLYQTPQMYLSYSICHAFYTRWQTSGVWFREKKLTNMHLSKQAGGVQAHAVV